MCDCPQHAGQRITLDDIEAAKTPRGGWTRQQIEAWGLTWPPRKGWKYRLVMGEPDFPAVQRLNENRRRS